MYVLHFSKHRKDCPYFLPRGFGNLLVNRRVHTVLQCQRARLLLCSDYHFLWLLSVCDVLQCGQRQGHNWYAKVRTPGCLQNFHIPYVDAAFQYKHLHNVLCIIEEVLKSASALRETEGVIRTSPVASGEIWWIIPLKQSPLNAKPPPHKHERPLLKFFWRRFWFGQGSFSSHQKTRLGSCNGCTPL